MASESVRLRGTARAQPGGRRPLRRVTLVSGEKTVGTVDEGEVDVDLVDGGTVTIEVPASGLVLVGATASILKGAWSELRDRPEAAGLVRNVIAPFTDAELHVVSAEPTDPIEVYGTVYEWAFEEVEATVRTAPTRHPSRVVAEIVALGREPEDVMRAMTMAIAERERIPGPVRKRAEQEPPASDPGDPRVGPPAITWVPFAVTAFVAIMCGVAVLQADSAAIAWALKVTGVMWGALAVSFRPWRDVPEFHHREKPFRKRTGREFAARLLLGSAPFCLAVTMWGSRGGGLSSATFIAASIVFLVGWTVSEVFWNSQAYGLLATLVAAPRPALAQASGQSGTCEGVVSDPTPARMAGEEVALGVVTSWRKGLADDPDAVISAKLHAKGTFLVETKEGAVTIDPDDCLWATTVRQDPDRPRFGYSVSEWIPVGGRIVAYGRFLRRGADDKVSSLRLSSVGTTPVIVLATSERGDPLRLARRLVWHRRITLLGLALAVSAALVLCLTRPM